MKNTNKTLKGHRLRIGRHSESNQVYLITTTTHRRNPIFVNIFTGRIAIQSMKVLHEKKDIESLTYVVMPDHIHWLFKLGHKRTLAEVVRRFKGYSSFKINNAFGTTNTKVWQNGYHDHAIRQEEDIKTIARYIVANPLRAGIVENIGDYPLWDATWL